jgi:hypothetical protein
VQFVQRDVVEPRQSALLGLRDEGFEYGCKKVDTSIKAVF